MSMSRRGFFKFAATAYATTLIPISLIEHQELIGASIEAVKWESEYCGPKLCWIHSVSYSDGNQTYHSMMYSDDEKLEDKLILEMRSALSKLIKSENS